MTELDFATPLRLWISGHRDALQARGIELQSGELPDGAGNDPVIWLDLFRGERGGRLAVWRAGDTELEVADFTTGQSTPSHFTPGSPQEVLGVLDRLLDWIGAGDVVR